MGFDLGGIFDPFDMMGKVGGILGGNQSAGYDKASKQMEEYMRKANEAYQPFLNAGQGAIPQFQDWMKQYQDPNKFMENAFSKYQMSPGAMNQMNQAQRAAGNAASSSGLSGSTAHMREAGNIASQATSNDMQQYLKNILGIGGQYGQGLNTLMGHGMGAAGGMSGNYGNMGSNLANMYGGGAAANQNQMNQLLGMGMNLLPFLF